MKYFFLFSLLVFLVPLHAQEINQTDTNGLRHGKWQKTYPNSSQIRYRGQFNHGREVGLFEYFDLQKNKFPYLTRQFNDSNRVAVVTYYLPENGTVVSRGKMIDSLKTGIWVYFHKNTKDTLMAEKYLEGKLQGEKRIFFPNGKLTELSFHENGVQQGLTRTYDEVGNLLSEIEYKDGKMNGEARYYESAKLTVKGQYKNGMRSGTWEFYKNGDLVETKQF